MLSNPYLDFFNSLPSSCRRHPGTPLDASEMLSPDWLQFKAAIAAHFAWSVPTDDAISTIGRFTRRVMEIGAGSGYWAWLLQQSGIPVRAFDASPPAFVWHAVERGDESEVSKHRSHSLLLSWPPWGSPMAAKSLANYKGKMIFFIGEWGRGCADPEFFSALNDGYDIAATVDLPQWYMRDDRLFVFARRRGY